MSSSAAAGILAPLRSSFEPIDMPVSFEEDNPLGATLVEGVLDRTPYVNKGIIYCRRGVKVVALIASGVAKLPYGPIAIENLPAGGMFATANIAGFFVLGYWAISATIDRLMPSQRSLQSRLTKQLPQGNTCEKIGVLAVSASVAVVSQLPTALPVFTYLEENYSSWVWPSFCLLMIDGGLLPTESLYLSFDHFIQKMRYNSLSEVEKQLFDAGEVMANLVRDHQDVFRGANLLEKFELIDEMKKIVLIQNGEDRFASLTDKFFKEVPSARLPEYTQVDRFQTQSKGWNWFSNLWSIPGLARVTGAAAKVIGAYITADFQRTVAEYVWYQSHNALKAGDALSGTLTAISTIGICYLTTQVHIASAQTTARLIQNRQPQPSLAYQLRPGLYAGLMTLALVNNVLAMGPSWVIWGDVGAKGEGEYYTRIKMCTALIMMLQHACAFMAEDLTIKIIKWKGSVDEREIIQYDEQLSLSIKLIENSPLLSKAQLLNRISPARKDEILAKVKLSKEQLDGYIRERRISARLGSIELRSTESVK